VRVAAEHADEEYDAVDGLLLKERLQVVGHRAIGVGGALELLTKAAKGPLTAGVRGRSDQRLDLAGGKMAVDQLTDGRPVGRDDPIVTHKLKIQARQDNAPEKWNAMTGP